MFKQRVFEGGHGPQPSQAYGFPDKTTIRQSRVWRDGRRWRRLRQAHPYRNICDRFSSSTAGFARRFAALGLSVVNVVGVISLSEIAPAALQQQVSWGSLLAGLAIYGSGS